MLLRFKDLLKEWNKVRTKEKVKANKAKMSMIETMFGQRMTMAKQNVTEAVMEMNKLIGATGETDGEAILNKMKPFAEVNTCLQVQLNRVMKILGLLQLSST